MINGITVSGFKSIRQLPDFELRQLNVIVGANGAGKSNFLSLFKLLNKVAEEGLQRFVAKGDGADNLLCFGRKTTSEIVLHLQLNEHERNYGYYLKLIPTAQNKLIIGDENYWYLTPGFMTVQLAQNDEESKLQTNREGEKLYRISENKHEYAVASIVSSFLKALVIHHFHDTSETARVKQDQDIHDNYSLKPDAKNLASILYRLQNHQHSYYERIVNTIRLAAPFFDDFILRPNPVTGKTVRLRWRHRENDDDFDVSQLSDGTLRFICLTTLLLQPDPPSLIIIDEPELGLHPYAINLLAAMLQSASVKSQIIVSTQSVELVNQFQPEDVIVVDREDNQSVFKRLSEKELEHWLGEYSLGELWEMNVLGGRP